MTTYLTLLFAGVALGVLIHAYLEALSGDHELGCAGALAAIGFSALALVARFAL